MKYLIQPISLEEYDFFKCDGRFTGIPFLKKKDDTFELKPEGEVYIGTYLDGERTFIPISTLSSRGVLVEPNQTGEVQLNLTLPIGD